MVVLIRDATIVVQLDPQCPNCRENLKKLSFNQWCGSVWIIIWIQFLAIVSCFCSLSAVPFQAVPSQFPSVYLSIQLFYIHANLFPCCQVWRGEDGLPQSGWLRQDSQCCHWSQGFRPNLSRQAVVKYFSFFSGLWIQIHMDPHSVLK